VPDGQFSQRRDRNGSPFLRCVKLRASTGRHIAIRDACSAIKGNGRNL
jgi:hypothetical protein